MAIYTILFTVMGYCSMAIESALFVMVSNQTYIIYQLDLFLKSYIYNLGFKHHFDNGHLFEFQRLFFFKSDVHVTMDCGYFVSFSGNGRKSKLHTALRQIKAHLKYAILYHLNSKRSWCLLLHTKCYLLIFILYSDD